MDVYKERISEVLSNPDLYIKSSERATSYNSWLKDYLLQGVPLPVCTPIMGLKILYVLKVTHTWCLFPWL